MTKNDGGPAFARPGFTDRDQESQEGMSLRDWFAGMALPGLDMHEKFTDVAELAYRLSDAMIAEREKVK